MGVRTTFDRGDHIHPSERGHQATAEAQAVDLEALLGRGATPSSGQ